MELGLSESLPALVARRFKEAKDAGHLVFSPTQLSTIHTAGVAWQLRYCPALAKKPTNQPKNPEAGPKPDPFQNPSPDLLLAEFPPENPKYSLVLNKFPVIPNHFILATKEWKSQTDMLEKEDLEAAYTVLQAWGDAEREQGRSDGSTSSLFAFFNSGDASGASQPHRHIQFLPVDAMRQPGSEGWEPLIDELNRYAQRVLPCVQTPSCPALKRDPLPRLPFTHFAFPVLQRELPLHGLHLSYCTLYKVAVAAPGVTDGEMELNATIPKAGPALISYNLAMTETMMVICPRRQESALVPVESPPTAEILEPGVVAMNGTILAGTLMVKAEAEWDALRRDPELLTRGLATIGYPRSDGFGPCDDWMPSLRPL